MKMIRILLFLSALLVLINSQIPPVSPIVPMTDGRIVGGVATTIEEFPYQVSVQVYGKHECGGSIINLDRVLTAYHCTAPFRVSSLSVRAGSTYWNRGGIVVQVESVCQHPQYNIITMENDVSVLRLSECLHITKAILPIALPKLGSSVPVGSLAVVSGWGVTSERNDSLPSVLQKVSVPKVSQENCKNAYKNRKITDSMTCYGFVDGGKDTCQSDSGGPIVIGGIQVGVVSWGRGCARPGFPGVYADLSPAIIQDHINSC